MGSTKIGYTNAQSLGTNSLKKGKVSTLSSRHQARKQCTFDKHNSRAVYIAFLKSCNPKRFVQCRNKVERKHIQEQQPSQFHCCNQNTGFVNRMGQHLVKHSLGIRMKKWWWPPVVWKVDVVLQCVWVLYRINNEDDECLPLLSFWRDVVNAIFLKHSKKGRLSSGHVGVRNIPSDVYYDNTKHQVQSENKADVTCVKKFLTPLGKI